MGMAAVFSPRLHRHTSLYLADLKKEKKEKNIIRKPLEIEMGTSLQFKNKLKKSSVLRIETL